jgi:hypothetical protein
VGPDSLCWRAGFSDWIPVSEVKILASVLAPKPAKPIVVAPAVSVNVGMIAPSVVSVPVQSAFSAGGLVTTVQSEMQVPLAASSVSSPSISAQEDTGTWRPSAASALASLVKEEADFLAKPQAKKQEPLPEPTSTGGLLDLAEAEKPLPAPMPTPPSTARSPRKKAASTPSSLPLTPTRTASLKSSRSSIASTRPTTKPSPVMSPRTTPLSPPRSAHAAQPTPISAFASTL